MNKQLIELQVTEGTEEHKYVGRFLGFIKDDEFNALVQKPADVATKLESKVSQPLMTIISKFDNMKGYRLIMTIKKVDDDTVAKKTLYITEPLDMVKEVMNKKGVNEDERVVFQLKDNNTIVARETE